MSGFSLHKAAGDVAAFAGLSRATVQIAWHLGSATLELGPEEALALYERNWRHVDRAAMTAGEAALVKRLTATVGNGVLLV